MKKNKEDNISSSGQLLTRIKKPKTPVTFTVFNSNSPLSKSYSIIDGRIEKKAAAQMSTGTATLMEIDFPQFIEALKLADNSTAFGYGAFNGDIGTPKKIVTKKRLPKFPEAISRSKVFFSYPTSPGILMIDYDPDQYCKKTFTMDEFIKVLSSIIPGFNEAALIARGSVSSGVSIKGKGKATTTKGFHVYAPVSSASDIPRFGDILFKKLWLNNLGHIAHSANGAQLIRSIADSSVFSPERLDFVGPPILNDKNLILTEPSLVTIDGGYLNTQLIELFF